MSSAPTHIDLYWRPACGFCMALKRQIDKHGITVTEHNIWDDPAAAAHVRSVARGNETVPTVTVGDQSLVNPSIKVLLAFLAESAPHLVPDDYEPPEPSRVARVMGRILGD
jgi:glutaredoxin-like protein